MKKGLETYLYSTLGILAMLVILLAVNVIAARAKVRVDLTAERAYTLSKGTRNIISKLDTPVQIRFYCTQGENRMPVFLKTYAQRIEDLLAEYRQLSKGQIEVQKLDPEPDSDAEDSAKLDGVEGQPTQDLSERVYLGISVTMLDSKEVIPFLSPSRERLLEYDISRAISRVATADKPVVGVMSALPVAGQMNQMMMQMGRGGQPPWAFFSELKQDFTVKQVEMTVDKIPDDVNVLVIIHPKAVTDAAQYAIDQFVLRGGKLLAFLDPMAVLDRQSQQQMMMGAQSSSNLEKLLKAWGIAFDPKIVADMTYMGRTRAGRAPAVLAMTEKAMNKDDVLTSDADNLFMVFAGAFTGTPVEGLRESVLIHSSKDSELVEPMMAQMSEEEIIKNFSASGTEYPLAIRLTGKFKSAFPDGKPKADAKDAAKKPEEKPEDKKDEASLKESTAETTVVLVGDSDMVQDNIAVTEAMNPFGGQRMVMPANGNLAFAQGAVEQLTGDSNLIAIRSRATRERPFTVIKKMEADAEAKYREKTKELETSLAETQRKLNELQRAKSGESSQRFILSPEQQKEVANFKAKEADAKKQLKQVRKELRADTDRLENRIKWINILGTPALVAAIGLVVAAARKSKSAAR